MPKLLATALLAATAASGVFAADDAGGFKPDPHFSNSDQIRELLAEGVKEYQAGRVADAAKSFRDVLLQHPEEKLCYEFYLAAGNALLIEMEERDELKDVLHDILRQGRIYEQALRHDDKYLDLLIHKLNKSEEERLVATNELIAVGPIAIPLLVSHMNDNREDDLRVFCRIVLSRMGYRSVIPLIAALDAKDERTVTSVALVLADIGDPRPLPKLKQLLDSKDSTDVVKRVITNTLAAITAHTGVNEVTAADKLYFLEAMRYFRGGDLVRDEMVANETLVWRWDESKDEANHKLTYVRVPRYAWKELIAENLLFAGLANYPNFSAYQPLLAAVLAAEDIETTERVRLAKERTSPPVYPDESVDAINERAGALSEASLRVRMFGSTHLLRAVQESIVSERYDVATYLMRLLQDPSLTHADITLPTAGLAADKSGTVLVAALDHTDKMVRYQAAITLAYLDPSLHFFNAQKVVPNLSDAIGESGSRVVLVVDQDYRQRNIAREQLQGKGYRVYAVQDGFEVMQRLAESPIKDAIVISGDLIPTVRDQYGRIIDVDEQNANTLVDKLAKDWRCEHTPIFISLPDDPALGNRIRKLFEGKDNVKGFIQKPFNSIDLAGQIDAAIGKSEEPSANRDEAEEIALHAALALQQPDVARTQFDLSKAGEALVKTLDSRSDTIRIETLKALGHAARSANGALIKDMITKVTDIYGTQDAQLKPAVRAAWLYAIGELNPTSDASVAILLKALQYEDADKAAQLQVRTAAADAVAHGFKTNNDLLYKYELQQRLDVRGQGAGKDDTGIKIDNGKPGDAAAPTDAGAAAPADAKPADAAAPADAKPADAAAPADAKPADTK